MPSTASLSADEKTQLRSFQFLIRNPDEVYARTTAGEMFDCADHAAMAYLIWRRMGRSQEATGAAWRRLMQSDCPTADVMALVAHHVYKQCDMDQLKTT